jgi:lipopolysaccharide/colanic/teichoic acid biosynthesis glycosyltransferase
MGGKSGNRRFHAIVKRGIDIGVSLIGLVALAPVLALISLVILVRDGAPALFRQNRAGLDGQIFQLIKFRTMSNKRDENGELLADHRRLTGVGRFLRRFSLDEAPQLWNVLIGDMSLVGPRPLLAEYLPLYSPRQFRRHEVKPGIVGWAQVNGRNSRTWEEKFELDLYYVENSSITLDLKIILMAIKTVLSGQGLDQGDQVTMERFRGNQ